MNEIKRRKPASEVFDTTFQIRINSEEKARFLAAAQALGLDHSKLLRDFMKKIAATNLGVQEGIK